MMSSPNLPRPLARISNLLIGVMEPPPTGLDLNLHLVAGVLLTASCATSGFSWFRNLHFFTF